jgi:transmembrane sensor
MHGEDEIDWTLLARYFAGERSAADAEAVERWLAADPARRDEIAALRRWWDDARALPSPARVDTMWTSLAARMHSGADTAPRATRPSPVTSSPRRPTPVLAIVPRSKPARRWAYAGIGAMAAGLIIAAGTALYRHGAVPPTELAAEPAAREFATGRGQRATIRLVDGSRVELGFASTLRVRQFENGLRELFLEGEAVFDVVHDASRPFIVHAANATTEDLGTVFGVRAYPGDSTVRVVVVSGRVALRPRTEPGGAKLPGTVLLPGQLGRLDEQGRVRIVSRVDTSAYLGWLSGRVAFDNVPLADIAADLERRFSVDIRISESAIAARRVTVVDMPAQSVTDVLDAAVVPLGLRFSRSGDVISIGR